MPAPDENSPSGPDLDLILNQANRRQELLNQLQLVQERFEPRMLRVIESLRRFQRILPRGGAFGEDSFVPPVQREVLANALLDLCRTVREEGFGRGIELILERDGPDIRDNRRLAIHLYRLASDGHREGVLGLLNRLDELPKYADGFDQSATSQRGVWEDAAALLGVIFPMPSIGGVPSWHPDVVEAMRLQSELAERPRPQEFKDSPAPDNPSVVDTTLPTSAEMGMPLATPPDSQSIEPPPPDTESDQAASAGQLTGPASAMNALQTTARVSQIVADPAPLDLPIRPANERNSPASPEMAEHPPRTFGELHEQMKTAESDPRLFAWLQENTPEWEFLRYAGRRIAGHEGFYVVTIEALAHVFQFELDLNPEELKQLPLSRAAELLKQHFRSGRTPVAGMPAGWPIGQATSLTQDPATQSIGATLQHTAEEADEVSHADGPEAPHWLWLDNRRFRIGTDRSRLSWFLLKYFWERESAAYEDLQGLDKPWSDPVTDSAIATAVNRFNNDMPQGFPWALATKQRHVYRKSRQIPVT